MKKIVLILVFTLFSISSLNLKAQYHFDSPPDSNQYDLLYIFDTTFFTNCFMTSDTNRTYIPNIGAASIPYSYTYERWGWYAPYYKLWCDPNVPVLNGYVIGANSYNIGSNSNNTEIYAKAFAQDYYLDQTNIPYDEYVIVGVAMKIREPLDDFRTICILNDNFDTISSTIFHTFDCGPSMNEVVNWHRGGWNTYYFPQRDYESLKNIHGFKIAFDVPKYYPAYFYMDHTCNVYSPCLKDSIYANGGPYEVGLNYDTIFYGMYPWNQLHYNLKDSLTGQWYSEDFRPDHYSMYNIIDIYLDWIKTLGPEDHIPLCSFSDEKYIKRYDDQWVRFVDDPVYTIWQNIYIAMVPIIMIPSNTQSLPEAELQKMCYLFPNPTQDYFKVMSHYTIESVQLYDIVGKLVLEKKVNNFETGLDVSNFAKGSYIVKINTVKGSVKRKLIVE